jgi:hypothetical protein
VIGDADVTIRGGVDGVGDSGLPEVPEVLQGPFLIYQCRLVVRSLILLHSAIWCSCLPLSEASLRSTSPAGGYHIGLE